MQEPATDAPSEHRPRRSRAALRELLLEAAVEVLRRDGVGITAAAITYHRVFEHLEATQGIRVTRGSVHERIWSSQREFQLDVLRRAAHWDATATNAATAEAVASVLASADLSTESGRWESMRQIWRLAGPINLAAAEERDHWSSWIGIALALSADDSDEPDRGLLDAVAESYRALTDELMEMGRGTQALLAARIRPDLVPDGVDGERLLTMLGTAVADGIALRRQLTDDLEDVELATGPDGALETWDPFAIAMWAITSYFVELEPDEVIADTDENDLSDL